MSDDEVIAGLARALGHPARVRIVRLLAAQRECRGAEVFSELPLAQSTISEHLRILRDAGLVTARPLGTSTVYCLAPQGLRALAEEIGAIAQCAAEAGEGTC